MIETSGPPERFATLAERKSAEAARRRSAAEAAIEDLRAFSRRHGGRFVVFGSFAAGRMRFDSDLDILLDFPAEAGAEAWRFAEEVGRRHGVPVDLHDAGTTRPDFVERVLGRGIVLS